MDGWVGSQDVMHYGEHAPVKISRIGIDRLDAQPKQQRRYQDNEPTDLGIMRMGWGQQHKDRQIGLATGAAAIAQIASQWTLAHEVGHVLGLSHISGENTPACTTPNFTRLMTGCSTSNITGTPTVVQSEINTMRASNLTQTC
jgi:hypothetical protein